MVSIACWRDCNPSASVCSPHTHCDSMCLVMMVPLGFFSCQSSGKCVRICWNALGPSSIASIMRGNSRVCECSRVVSGGVWGWVFWVSCVIVTIVICVVSGAMFARLGSGFDSSIDEWDTLSSSAVCLVVSLIGVGGVGVLLAGPF